MRRIADTLVPLGFGYGLFLARPWIYRTWCAVEPTPCTMEQVPEWDRWAFAWGSIRADFWSNVVQNSVGTLYFLLPWLLVLFKRWSIRSAFQLELVFLQVMLWNFVGLEAVRAWAQRPRPLVIQSPMIEGLNVHHYTSFYSGHTSFVALACTTLVVLALRLGGNRWNARMTAFSILAVAFTALTGALRVMGGRHYPTDVLAGALFGTAIAVSIARVHLKPRPDWANSF